MQIDGPQVADWLRQFADADRPTALTLVQIIYYVSADDFRAEIVALLRGVAENIKSPIALYAERRIPGPRDAPNRLYKWPRRKVRRAAGAALQPADPERFNEPDIGSEGIVANIISTLQREEPNLFRVHPSMCDLRQRQPRKFILVTDFIGSGGRVRRFLDSAWKVPTIVSWASYQLISFEVVAYSATDAGTRAVEQHPCKPKVTAARGCPTIGLLPNPLRDRLTAMCEDYCPLPPTETMTPLGYCGTGALIVFSHGAPNNVPLILHKRSRSWVPLFPARTTNIAVSGEADKEGELDERLVLLREQQLKAVRRLRGLDAMTRQTVLVLSALKRLPRSAAVVSARTGLTICEVELAIGRAKRAGFLGVDLRPTQKAYAEFKYLRKVGRPEKVVLPDDDSLYFPMMLRPPRRI